MVHKEKRSLDVGMSKKTEKPIKPRKPKKNNRKNRTVKKNRLNWLKNHKIFRVRFGFGFQSLKPIEWNRTGPVQLSYLLIKKKKTSINSIFSNSKLISPFSLSQPPPLPALSSLKSAFFSMLSASHLSNLS